MEGAVERFGLEYPIAMDNDFQTWRWFGNGYWPTKYLFHASGNLRIQHSGEGAYQSIEKIIQELLAETGADVSGIPLVEDEKFNDMNLGQPYEFGATRELLAIGSIINHPHLVDRSELIGKEVDFRDNGLHEKAGIYLDGRWIEEEDYVHLSEDGNIGSFLVVYWGKAVSPVLGSLSSNSFEVIVLLDGSPVPREFAGGDIRFDSDGNSIVDIFGPPRLYSFVNSLVPDQKHELMVMSDSEIAICPSVLVYRMTARLVTFFSD